MRTFSLYWLRDRDAGNIMKHKNCLLESNKNCRFNCTPSVLLNRYMLNAWRQKDNHKHCSQLGRGQWGGVCNSCCIRWENQLFPKIRGALSRGEGGRTERGSTQKCWLKFLPSLSSSAATREEKQWGQQSHRVKLTAWKCCRGEQALLCKLPRSLPLPGSSARCRCALQHCPAVSVHAPKRNASIMKNLSTSRLNQQQS